MLLASDLANKSHERTVTNHETYKLILAQCYESIKRCNGRALKQMQFAVPDRYGGRPPFKQTHALQYLRGKLMRGGFQALHVPPHILYISWVHAQPTAAKKKGRAKS